MAHCVVVQPDTSSLALAVALVASGMTVTVVDPSKAARSKALSYRGLLGSGEAPIEWATGIDAVARADIVVVSGNLSHRADVATSVAQLVRSEQIVLLTPGGVGGALAFRTALREASGGMPIIAELPGFPYLATLDNGILTIDVLKQGIAIGVLPSSATRAVRSRFAEAIPGLQPASSVLETGLKNTNVMIHPAVTLLNAARVEHGESFRFYREGIGPSVGRLIDAMDRERQQLARALGIDDAPIEVLMRQYYADDGMIGDSIYEQLATFEPFAATAGPAGFDHRYVRDDIPFGIAPMASIGRQIGVPMSLTTALVDLWSVLLAEDLWSAGNTTERMGIGEMTIAQLQRFVTDGGGIH